MPTVACNKKNNNDKNNNMLSDFFSINLPYGISRTEDDEWFAFNREYLPLGWNEMDLKDTFHIEEKDASLPVYTKYNRITEKLLRELAWHEEDGIQYDDEGKIKTVWLYNGETNPMGHDRHKNTYWKIYFDKLKKISKLKRRN